MNDKDTVVVPCEPTPEMIDRFVSRALCVSVHGDGGWSNYAREQWSAMIAAAPSTSVREEGVAEALERAAKVADLEGMAADTQMNAGAQGAAIAAARIATAIRALKPSTDKGGDDADPA